MKSSWTMHRLLLLLGIPVLLSLLPAVWHATRHVADMQKYPREGFGFALENGYGERIDTFTGTITKDLVVDPDTTISVRFREADLETIYRKVIETRFFDLPEPHPPYPNPNQGGVPNTTFTLVVKAGGVRKELQWSTEYMPFRDLPPEWQRLHDLMQEIDRIRNTYPEYRALPTPRAFYL